MASTTPVPASSGSDVPASGGGFGEYLRGVREELQKAKWPDRAELLQLTKVVLVIIAVVAVYCGALDGILGLITNQLFNRH